MAVKTEHDVERLLGIKMEPIDQANELENENNGWIHEKEKMVKQIIALKTENQRTILAMKQAKSELTSLLAENQKQKVKIANLVHENKEITAKNKQLQTGLMQKPAESKTETCTTDEDDQYEVEKILNHKNCRKYLVRWKNFGAEDDSWVDEENINCSKMLAKYKKLHMKQK